MSFSVMPPTPWWMTLTRTSGCWIFASSQTAASTEPCDVALEDEVEVLRPAPACICSKRFSSETPACARCASCSRRSRSPRSCARCARLALVLDDAARARRRAAACRSRGSRPGRPGSASLTLLAAVVVERAHLAPRVAGDDRVADPQRAALDEHRRDRAAADVEARLDDRARRLGVRVRASARARRPRRAGSSRAGRRGSRLCFAETSANCVVAAPLLGLQALGWRARPCTRSGFASGRSILLTATTIGTSAARACEIDSFVCGMTPSSAATTSTAMSVTFAPRARIAVNASWPGVSRNVILRPSSSTW